MPGALLREHQHELLGPDETEGFLFGTEDTGFLTLSRPIIIAGDIRDGDQERPQEDGRMFGTDYRGGKTFQFEIGVLTDRANGFESPHSDNLEALARLEAAWTDPVYRDNPLAHAVLRSCEAGRVSRCYGRPRPYDETAGKLTQAGFTPTVAQFMLVDDLWYDDDPEAVTLGMLAPSEGGLIAPIVAPLTTTRTSSTEQVAHVGGTKPTWPVVTFFGPCTNPVIEIGDLHIGIVGPIALGTAVTYDPRPWMRTITVDTSGLGGGVSLSARSVAGRTTQRTPVMRKARLVPGVHPISYVASDPTGTSYATVSWRNARPRP